MNTELVKQNEENEVAIYNEGELGACADISMHDLQIGRVVVMQPSSTMVKEDKARQGAIIDLESEEELGYKMDKKLVFLVVKSQKYWVEYIDEEFHQRVPALHENEKPWQEGDISRVFTHSFYVLLRKDIEQGLILPYEIAFKSTDLKSAKRISKILMIMGQQRKPSWDRWFTMGCELFTKGKYSWFKSKIEVINEEVPQSCKNVAYTLHEQFKKASVKHTEEHVDDGGKEEENCDY